MKKLLIILVITAFCLSGCGNNDKTSQNIQNENTSDYSASKTSTSTNNSSNINANNSNSSSNNNDVVIINNQDNINTETDIASFSTKIYTPNDEARMNNLRITCSKLNGTIVKPRRNFFIL